MYNYREATLLAVVLGRRWVCLLKGCHYSRWQDVSREENPARSRDLSMLVDSIFIFEGLLSGIIIIIGNRIGNRRGIRSDGRWKVAEERDGRDF